MDALGMLEQQLQTVNLRLHHSARDLTRDELVARPIQGVNPIGFLVWHMARGQDWAVNTAIRDVPEVIRREPWAGSPLAVPGIGTGFDLEEAARAAAQFELSELLRYADAVHDDTLAWLRTVDEAILDDIPDVAAHDAPHPEYQTPGFRAEMDSGPEHDDAVGRKGGLPVWVFLTSVSVTHLHRHLGELDLVKDLLRRGAAGDASRGVLPVGRRSQP
jgi:DinB superfamily